MVHVLPAAGAALHAGRRVVHAEGGQAVVRRDVAEVAHAAHEGPLGAEGLPPRCCAEGRRVAERLLERRVQPQPRRLPPLRGGVPLARRGAPPLHRAAHLAPEPPPRSAAPPSRASRASSRVVASSRASVAASASPRPRPGPGPGPGPARPRPRPLSHGGGGARLERGGVLGEARRTGAPLLLERLLARLRRLLVVQGREGGGGRYAQARCREGGRGQAVRPR